MRISLIRLNQAETNRLLTRIADALDRLSPPIPPDPTPPTPRRKSNLQDLRITSPAELDERLHAEAEFARLHQVIPGTEAFMDAVSEFEKSIIAQYGSDGHDMVANLPWNRRHNG